MRSGRSLGTAGGVRPEPLRASLEDALLWKPGGKGGLGWAKGRVGAKQRRGKAYLNGRARSISWPSREAELRVTGSFLDGRLARRA